MTLFYQILTYWLITGIITAVFTYKDFSKKCAGVALCMLLGGAVWHVFVTAYCVKIFSKLQGGK